MKIAYLEGENHDNSFHRLNVRVEATELVRDRWKTKYAGSRREENEKLLVKQSIQIWLQPNTPKNITVTGRNSNKILLLF